MSEVLEDLLESARPVLAELGIGAAAEPSWARIAELGWLLVSLPENMNGLEQGLAGACAFHRLLGRSLPGAPYLPAMLSIDAVSQTSFAGRDEWLERMTAGDFVTVPMVEPSARLTQEQAGKGRLHGLARAVPSADRSSHILVCIPDHCVVLVPSSQSGVSLIPRETWDASRRLYDVEFKDVSIDDALVIARGGESSRIARRLAIHRDFALAADSVGGAESLLEQTVEYLQTRRQFGRPLALFQALKHRCADLKSAVAAAEALLLNKLGKVDAQDDELGSQQIKSLACSVYARLAEEAVQLHGGIGVTSEHPCHLFLKRALLNEQLGHGLNDAEIGAALLATI